MHRRHTREHSGGMRRFAISTCVGLAVTILPILVNASPLWMELGWVNILMLPGALAGIVLGISGVHDTDSLVAMALNAVLFGLATYMATGLWGRFFPSKQVAHTSSKV